MPSCPGAPKKVRNYIQVSLAHVKFYISGVFQTDRFFFYDEPDDLLVLIGQFGQHFNQTFDANPPVETMDLYLKLDEQAVIDVMNQCSPVGVGLAQAVWLSQTGTDSDKVQQARILQLFVDKSPRGDH